LNDLLKAVNLETWKAYLQFHTIDANIAALSSDFYSAYFDYNYKALNGQETMKTPVGQIVRYTDGDLGMDSGKYM
jgi:predicted metalloendopeptidase